MEVSTIMSEIWMVAQTTSRDMNELVTAWNDGKLWLPSFGYNVTDTHRAVYRDIYCGVHGTFH
jgi:hypothetical protein